IATARPSRLGGACQHKPMAKGVARRNRSADCACPVCSTAPGFISAAPLRRGIDARALTGLKKSRADLSSVHAWDGFPVTAVLAFPGLPPIENQRILHPPGYALRGGCDVPKSSAVGSRFWVASAEASV